MFVHMGIHTVLNTCKLPKDVYKSKTNCVISVLLVVVYEFETCILTLE